MSQRTAFSRIALVAAAAVGVAVPSQAFAGSDIELTVTNDLPQSTVPGYPQVSILEPASGQLYCWYSGELAFMNRDRNAVPRKGSRTFSTETKQSSSRGDNCLVSYGENSLDLGVYVKLTPTSKWITVGNDDRARSMSLRFEKAPAQCNWNNNLDYCFVLRRSLPTFSVPRYDFNGLLCWTVSSTANNNTLRNQSARMTITVRGDSACNTPRGQTIFPSKSGAPVYGDLPAPENNFPPKAATETTQASIGDRRENQTPPAPPEPSPDEPGKDEGSIVSFMSSTGVACQMLGILPNDKCRDVAKNELSNFANLTTDVRKFKITGSFGTVEERRSICSATAEVPKNAGAASVTCSESVTTSNSTATGTTHGASVGGSYSKKFEYTSSDAIKLFAGAVKSEHSVTVSGSYNYSSSTQKTTGTSDQKTVSVTAAAASGLRTRVEVFTQAADANYTYDADLDVGKRDLAQPVTTPAAEALGMSPSATQHCLAYLIGGPAVNGSIMERQKRLLDSGVRADDPSLPRSNQLFMQSAPFYRAGSTTCPGMPSMFPAVAGFTGKGVGTFQSLGYDDNGKPLKSWTVCVYTSPLGGQRATARGEAPRAEMQGDSSPCVQQKVDDPTPVKVAQPGQFVNLNTGAGQAQDAGRTFRGTNRSEQVIGTPRADDIRLGRGAFQMVRSGGGDDKVDAVEGTDQVSAGPGNDTVVVGSTDTAFGEQGNDTLSVTDARRSVLGGGTGDDALSSSNATQIALAGNAGNDLLRVTGTSTGVQMAGGPGNDSYSITSTHGGAAKVFEMPNRGVDTITTDRTITAPPYVERLVASGGGPVNLTSRDGRQTLTGNDASNVLSPGIGPDVAAGGGGNDAFLMNWDVPDTVTGGPGADLFIPLGTPATARYGSLAASAASHRITDFNPQEGDRIELRASVFGISVRNLPTDWRVAQGAAPRASTPNATILANTATGLLAFDRDGSGPVIPKVFAMVPDASGVEASWFTIA